MYYLRFVGDYIYEGLVSPRFGCSEDSRAPPRRGGAMSVIGKSENGLPTQGRMGILYNFAERAGGPRARDIRPFYYKTPRLLFGYHTAIAPLMAEITSKRLPT